MEESKIRINKQIGIRTILWPWNFAAEYLADAAFDKITGEETHYCFFESPSIEIIEGSAQPYIQPAAGDQFPAQQEAAAPVQATPQPAPVPQQPAAAQAQPQQVHAQPEVHQAAAQVHQQHVPAQAPAAQAQPAPAVPTNQAPPQEPSFWARIASFFSRQNPAPQVQAAQVQQPHAPPPMQPQNRPVQQPQVAGRQPQVVLPHAVSTEQNLLSSIKAYILQNKSFIAASAVVFSYVTVLLKLFKSTQLLKNKDAWHAYKGSIIERDFISNNAQQMANDLLVEIKYRYDADDPELLRDTIKIFLKDIEREKAQLQSLVSWNSRINALWLDTVFPNYDTEAYKAEAKIIKLEYMQQLMQEVAHDLTANQK